MLDRIFPRQFDNIFRGYRIGLILFGLVVVLKLVISTNSILNTRMVATTADGIPLDSFGHGGAQTVILLFALLALSNLVLALQGVLALIRYRSMVPLLYLGFLVTQIGGRALNMLYATPRTDAGSNAFYINVGLLATLSIGFALSLLQRSGQSPDRTA